MDKKKKSSLMGIKDKKKGESSTTRRNLSQESEELGAKDERFAHVLKNPIYRGVPKKEKKVDIDKRFQSMFHDDQFKLKYKIDKRGRPVQTTTDENLKKYYNLVDDEGQDDSDDDDEKPEIKDEPKSEDDEEASSSSSIDDDEVKVEGEFEETADVSKRSKVKLSAEVKKKLRDADIDYARGEGDFVSEESSDGDSSSEEEQESDVEHEWGEMDQQATRTEESTNRLALCNMDWDRLKSVDLMVLFTSFLPAGGVLKSISIYTSEYGKQRMAEEELQGPAELKGFKREENSDDEEEEEVIDYGGSDHEDDDEGTDYHREKLRQYQLNRLKYFYAVLELDSKETAEIIYTECDGREYESSAAKIDLRFIPDDMTFDEKPHDRCDTLPDSGNYRPKFFTTTALQQVKVDCTWDETDPSRKDMIDRVFNSNEKVDDEDLKAYLASSSESEDEELTGEQENNGDDTASVSGADPIAKYRALLDSIEQTEKKKKEKDVELEITWGVGLKKKTEDLVKKKLEEKDGINMTPWEEQLSKQKDKRKQKKVAKRKTDSGDESNSQSSDSEGDDQPFSDDDVDVDLNDEFFQDEMRNNEVFKSSKKAAKKKEPKEKLEDDPKSSAELELLLMDDQDHKNHFNLKKIIDGENDSKSKKKRKFKKAKKDKTLKPETKDDFNVDVSDNRFSALFTSHHFNIDPSDPNFKKTNAMEVIIGEKQKRRTTNLVDDETSDKSTKTAEVKHSQQSATKKAELKYLVKSIRRNTMNAKKGKQLQQRSKR